MPQIPTLEETLQLSQEASRDLVLFDWETYQSLLEQKSEREAENAWLHAAENAGWEEAYLESLIESGLRLP